MARIAGVDLPRNKRIEIGLTYIFGVGKVTAQKVLDELGVDRNIKTDKLTEDQVNKIRGHLEKNFQVEGDLRRKISLDIKRLVDLGCYRGLRHRKNLPVRGQRTHTNARTRKGPAKAVSVRKPLKVSK